MIIEIPDSCIDSIINNLKEAKENPVNNKCLNSQAKKELENIKEMVLSEVLSKISDKMGFPFDLDDTYEWSYETGESIYFGRQEIVFNQVQFTKFEDMARKLFKKDGRNYLLRKRQEGTKSIRQRWNEEKKIWEDD